MRGKLAIAGALGAGLATLAASGVVAASSLLGVPGLVLAASALGAGMLGGLFGVVAAPMILGGDDPPPAPPPTNERVALALQDLAAGRYSEVRVPTPDEAPELAAVLRELARKLGDDRRTSLARENELREKLSNEVTLRREAERELAIERASTNEGSAQDAFLARMSHELRTPLNAVLGYSEMLLEDTEDEMARDDLSRIRSATLSLLAMVTSVLDLTQLHSGNYAVVPERLELAGVVQQVIDATRLEAEGHGNEVVADLDEGLVGVLDRRMVHSVLYNLVSNGCKYTTNGQVRVVGRTLADGRLRLQVEDSGIGMTERQIQEAFQPFRQADGSLTRRYDGSGLGLAVVRGFVEAMGGTVRIDSAIGKGATVSVELPPEVEAREPKNLFDEDEPTMLLR